MADQDPTLEEGADNPERPEWLPENFAAPEDLAKSYQEAQRKITELSQERRALEESVQTLAQQFEEFTAQQSRPDPQNVLSQWQEQYDADPFSTTLNLAQAVAQQTAQQILQQQANPQAVASPDVVAFIADQTMAQNFEDWGQYKEKAAEVISQNPLFQRDELWADPKAASQALESAYRMVKAEDVLSGNALVQQQAADTRQMKLNAQSAVGSSGRPPVPSTDQEEWARIKSAAPKPYWQQ